MAQQKIVILSQSDDPVEVKVRRVPWAAGNAPFPCCAWCKLAELRLLVEVVQQGFAWNLIEAVCYCDSCQLGTIVSFEAPALAEDGELISGV